MEAFVEKKGSDPRFFRIQHEQASSCCHISDLRVPFDIVLINSWLFAKLLACLTFDMEITIVHFSGNLWVIV